MGLDGRQRGASLSISTTRKSGNDPASPINAKPKLMRKSSGMKPPPLPFSKKNLPARDFPSKLAALPLDAYKRGESSTSGPGHSVASASSVDKKPAKGPLKHQQVPSGMVPFFLSFSPFIFSILMQQFKLRAYLLHLNPKPFLRLTS